jgi:hypothetical protein
MTEAEQDEIINNFFKELAKNQQRLEPEFQKVLDDNLWSLLG